MCISGTWGCLRHMSFLSFLGAQFSTKKTMMAGRIGCLSLPRRPRSQSICCFNCVVRDMFGPQIFRKKSRLFFNNGGGGRGFFYGVWVPGDLYMGVSENSGFSPQIIHFNRVFHYFHPPFWGFSPYFRKHPYHTCIYGHWYCCQIRSQFCQPFSLHRCKRGTIVSDNARLELGARPVSLF